MWKRIKDLLIGFAIKGMIKANLFTTLTNKINFYLDKYHGGKEIKIVDKKGISTKEKK